MNFALIRGKYINLNTVQEITFEENGRKLHFEGYIIFDFIKDSKKIKYTNELSFIRDKNEILEKIL